MVKTVHASESGGLDVRLEFDVLGNSVTQNGQNLVLVLIATALHLDFGIHWRRLGLIDDVADESSHVLKEALTVTVMLKTLGQDS